MKIEIENSRWVYVMVQNLGTEEQIVGQVDQEKEINFIPTFLTKEAAQQATLFIPKQKGKKTEIQAIIYEDLFRYAGDNNFLIFILDQNGKILSKPTTSAHK
jgi:spore cortex formation protein SpoVR/YcgB (stage V sporulation)